MAKKKSDPPKKTKGTPNSKNVITRRRFRVQELIVVRGYDILTTAKSLGVSVPTISRDLKAIYQEGLDALVDNQKISNLIAQRLMRMVASCDIRQRQYWEDFNSLQTSWIKLQEALMLKTPPYSKAKAYLVLLDRKEKLLERIKNEDSHLAGIMKTFGLTGEETKRIIFSGQVETGIMTYEIMGEFVSAIADIINEVIDDPALRQDISNKLPKLISKFGGDKKSPPSILSPDTQTLSAADEVEQ